jgi:hypothetical protein
MQPFHPEDLPFSLMRVLDNGVPLSILSLCQCGKHIASAYILQSISTMLDYRYGILVLDLQGKS